MDSYYRIIIRKSAFSLTLIRSPSSFSFQPNQVVCGAPCLLKPPLQGQSAKNGILAVSDLESHHRARGSCPWVFWDPLLHIKLGCRANPLVARGRGSTATKTAGNERFVKSQNHTETLKYSTMHNFHGLWPIFNSKGVLESQVKFLSKSNYLAPGWFKFCLRRKLPAPGNKGGLEDY